MIKVDNIKSLNKGDKVFLSINNNFYIMRFECIKGQTAVFHEGNSITNLPQMFLPLDLSKFGGELFLLGGHHE